MIDRARPEGEQAHASTPQNKPAMATPTACPATAGDAIKANKRALEALGSCGS